MLPNTHITGSSAIRASKRLWPLLLLLLLLLACSRKGEPPLVSSSPDQTSLGQQLYNANCLSCHGGATGGSMMDIPPTHNANGHTWHHPDCKLTDIVLNGSGEMGEMMRQMMSAPEGTPRMPTFKGTLTQEDIAAILAYIKTWWTDEQRQFQAKASQLGC